MRRRRGGWVLALGAVSALLTAAPAAAVIPPGNLVGNPGAELGPENPIQGWATSSPALVAFDYVQPDDPGLVLSVDDMGTDGCRGFFGGAAAASVSATQIINVTPAATAIDAGGVSAKWGASLGRVAGDDDYATAGLTFRNDQGGGIGATGVSGNGPTPLVSGLTAFDSTTPVPVGTRSIVVGIGMTQVDDTNNAYVDSVGLSLDGSDPTPNPPIECSHPGRSLTIKYAARRNRFKGRVRSADARCRPGKISVFKVKPGADRKVASATAAASGRWSARERNAHGRYYATTPETRGDGLVCKDVKSSRTRA